MEALLPGRIYGPEWSIENVARRLRFEAERGSLRGVDLKEDASYRRKCSARHVPSGCSIIFTRDDVPMNPRGWHASLCFIGEDDYRPWNEEIAERWLAALYGEFRPRVTPYGARTEIGAAKGVRHFVLEVDRW
jgi:hypothetical protein